MTHCKYSNIQKKKINKSIFLKPQLREMEIGNLFYIKKEQESLQCSAGKDTEIDQLRASLKINALIF